MESSVSIRTGEHSSDSHIVKNGPSKGKTIGFAIVIILGLGGLAVAGVGLGGYLQAGSLSSLGQVHSIIMMAAGGGGGIVFLIMGIIGSVKNRQLRNTEFIGGTSIGQIWGTACFGKAEWATYFGDIGDAPDLPDDIEKILNSPCPFSGDENLKVKDTHMLVLVPATIDGQQVTLNKLQEHTQHLKQGHKIECTYEDSIKDEHGNTPVERSHWVLMTRDVIPESLDKNYDYQKVMLKETDYVLPQAVEAFACILLNVASGTHFYGVDPTSTRCAETVKSEYPVIVGGFGSNGYIYIMGARSSCGVYALRKF